VLVWATPFASRYGWQREQDACQLAALTGRKSEFYLISACCNAFGYEAKKEPEDKETVKVTVKVTACVSLGSLVTLRGRLACGEAEARRV
jgi:hypothetical protein